jgi:hypothetical protein
VRPGDRGTKRLLARIGITAALQPVEATAEPRQDLGRSEEAGPRGRELDREWEVVEPRAELRDRVGVTGVEPERGSPREEKLDCFRCRQRRDRVHVLARELKPLPARDHDRGPARISKCRDRGRRSREQVLEVVEEQDRPSDGEDVDQGLLQPAVGLLRNAERERDR